MAGIKGRSGRKPSLNEKSMEEILNLSSEILNRWLSNSEVPDEKKIPIVAQIMVKRIPAKLEHTGDGFRALIVQYGQPAKAIDATIS